MRIDYTEVSDSFVGRFLGCAFASNATELLNDVEFSDVSVSMSLNNKEVDLLKTLSMFENHLDKGEEEPTEENQSEPPPESAAASNPPPGTGSFLTQEQYNRLEELIDRLYEKLPEIQSDVSSACGEAIGSASSSYYTGEYAQEAANEAGWENHPGEEFLSAEINDVCDLKALLRDINDSYVFGDGSQMTS